MSGRDRDLRVNSYPGLPGVTVRAIACGAVVLALAALGSRTASAQMPYTSYPPYAQDDSAGTMEGMPIAITVLNNDYGMSAPLVPSSVQIVAQPLNGIVHVDPSTGIVWYLPDPEFDGVDDFTYQVCNVNGQVSNVATVTVYVMEDSQPPVIENFSGAPSNGGFWIFTGQVVDDNPAGIVVTFGGLVSGSVTTASDGTFSFSASLPSGNSGAVSAEAVNDDGVASAIVYDYVSSR